MERVQFMGQKRKKQVQNKRRGCCEMQPVRPMWARIMAAALAAALFFAPVRL